MITLLNTTSRQEALDFAREAEFAVGNRFAICWFQYNGSDGKFHYEVSFDPNPMWFAAPGEAWKE